MHYKTAAVLVTALMAGSCVGAFARPAFTTFNANLRSGPGVDRPIVGIVPDQTQIEVGSCAGSWCRVRWEGAEGYLSSTLIAFAPRPANIVSAEPVTPRFANGARMVYPAGAICDPIFDLGCLGGGGRYTYYDGYGPGYANYAYDNGGFPFDMFGLGIFGPGPGVGYYNRPVVGRGWVTMHRTANYNRPAYMRGSVANRHMAVRTTGGLSGGGRFAANDMSFGRGGMRGR